MLQSMIKDQKNLNKKVQTPIFAVPKKGAVSSTDDPDSHRDRDGSEHPAYLRESRRIKKNKGSLALPIAIGMVQLK